MSAIGCPVVFRTTGDTPGSLLATAAKPRSTKLDFRNIPLGQGSFHACYGFLGSPSPPASRFVVGCPRHLNGPQHSPRRRAEV
jgi:hypothetical protein